MNSSKLLRRISVTQLRARSAVRYFKFKCMPLYAALSTVLSILIQLKKNSTILHTKHRWRVQVCHDENFTLMLHAFFWVKQSNVRSGINVGNMGGSLAPTHRQHSTALTAELNRRAVRTATGLPTYRCFKSSGSCQKITVWRFYCIEDSCQLGPSVVA